MLGLRWIGKDMEGSIHGISTVISQHFAVAKKWKTQVKVLNDMAKIEIRHFIITSYRITSTFIYFIFLWRAVPPVLQMYATTTDLHNTLISYVYQTVHYLDSWIQSPTWCHLLFLFHYLVLNMFQMLIYPSSGACDLFVELFHGLYCSGMMYVGVTLWFGWGGMVSGCRLKH